MVAWDQTKVGHKLNRALWDGDENDGALAKHVQGPRFIQIKKKIKKRGENK